MAIDRLAQGRLSEAVAALNQDVRARPDDLPARTLLFSALAFLGDWDRARKQLDAIESLGAAPGSGLDPAIGRIAIDAELTRRKVFAGEIPARVLGAETPDVVLARDVWDRFNRGELAEAVSRLQAAEDAASPRPGRLNGQGFDDFRDADDLLAPILEVFTEDGYFWVGWDDVLFLGVEPPRQLLDVLWCKARLATASGSIGVVMVPGLYPQSASHPDDLVRLGMTQDWTDLGAGLVRGSGLKSVCVGETSTPVTSLVDLQFDPAPSEEARE